MQVRALKAQTIWPQQVDAVAGGDLVQVGGQIGINPAGNHQCRVALDASGDFQCGSDLLRRQGNDGQVRTRHGQIGQRASGMNIEKRERATEALRSDGLVQYLGLGRL